ncbi:MAG TPA: FAD binding domain-containing protein [Thermoplasmata archaeon]|nr:FAD binding domain-containing protein [Thermoplasmata archaeon]
MAPFDLLSPRTVEEALATIRSYPADEVAVLAGGTDLLLDLDGERSAPRAVVSLRRLPWRTLGWNGPALTIGSTLPLRALETDPDLKRRLPALHEAVRAVGGVALRNRATLGGNLGRAAPASDLIPVLLVLDAEVELVGPGGARTMSVDQFVHGSRKTELGRAELIRSVRIPEARPSAYLWQRVRPANDISQLSVAVAYAPQDRSWRVALGGIPPRPVRVPEAEGVLVGTRPSIEAVKNAADRAAAHASLVTDRRASDDYRRRIAGVLLARAVRSAAARGEASP